MQDEPVKYPPTPGDYKREDPDIGTSFSSWDDKGGFDANGTEDRSVWYNQFPNNTKDTETPQLSIITPDSRPDDARSEDSYPDSLQPNSNTFQDGEAVVDFQPDSGSVPNVPTAFSSDLKSELSNDSIEVDDVDAAKDELSMLPERDAAVVLPGDYGVSVEATANVDAASLEGKLHSVESDEQADGLVGETPSDLINEPDPFVKDEECSDREPDLFPGACDSGFFSSEPLTQDTNSLEPKSELTDSEQMTAEITVDQLEESQFSIVDNGKPDMETLQTSHSEQVNYQSQILWHIWTHRRG